MEPLGPHLLKYYLSPKAAAGILRRAGRRGRKVTGPTSGGAGEVSPTVTAKWAKRSGGPAGDETQNLVLQDGTGYTHRREVLSALTTSYCGGIGGVDDNAAQAGYVVVQPTTVTRGVTHTLTSEGADASEDGTGRGTPVVVQAVNENQRGEITLSDNAAPLSVGGGKPGQVYPCIVQPLALRGREGGAALEIGPEGGPYNALRAGDGASSRQSLIAITAPHAAATLTAGTSSPGIGQETIVRRLTELECERLQGYPDDWTAGQSGSARYRELGNSVAVPVVEWTARRLVAVDEVIA